MLERKMSKKKTLLWQMLLDEQNVRRVPETLHRTLQGRWHPATGACHPATSKGLLLRPLEAIRSRLTQKRKNWVHSTWGHTSKQLLLVFVILFQTILTCNVEPVDESTCYVNWTFKNVPMLLCQICKTWAVFSWRLPTLSWLKPPEVRLGQNAKTSITCATTRSS